MEIEFHQSIISYSQIIISLVTGFIAYLVYRSTNIMAQMNYLRELGTQWNHLNFMIAQDDELWKIRKAFLDGTGKIDGSIGKNYILVASWVNIAESYYRGMTLGYLDRATTLDYIDQILRNLCCDKEGFAYYAERNGSDFHKFLTTRLNQL